MAGDSGNRLKLSFDANKYPQQPNTYSSPCVESSNQSNLEWANSESKSTKVELSKEAKILLGKLNIALAGSHETVSKTQTNERSFGNREDEKGEHFDEEFDQSRPMTTRIYDNDDDQQLHIQYKAMKLAAARQDQQANMMSAEAGLEGNNYESDDNDSDNLGDEQWSVIVKNIEDCNDLDFAFGSELHTPTQEWVLVEVNEEDIMTVIENDWENVYDI